MDFKALQQVSDADINKDTSTRGDNGIQYEENKDLSGNIKNTSTSFDDKDPSIGQGQQQQHTSISSSLGEADQTSNVAGLRKASMSVPPKSHHLQEQLCLTRPKYREGRRLTAVKVYTINDESVYLIVTGVPSIKIKRELCSLCQRYGTLVNFKLLEDYPAQQFTEAFMLKFSTVKATRFAKKLLDGKNFFGGIFHVFYAPELEDVDETRWKLEERSAAVLLAIKKSVAKTNTDQASKQSSILNQYHPDDKLSVSIRRYTNRLSYGKDAPSINCQPVNSNQNNILSEYENLNNGSNQADEYNKRFDESSISHTRQWNMNTNENLVSKNTFDNQSSFQNGQSFSYSDQSSSHNGQSYPHDGQSSSHNGKSSSHNGKSYSHDGQGSSHIGQSSSHNGQTYYHDGQGSFHNGQRYSHDGQGSSHSGHNPSNNGQSYSHDGQGSSHSGHNPSNNGQSEQNFSPSNESPAALGQCYESMNADYEPGIGTISGEKYQPLPQQCKFTQDEFYKNRTIKPTKAFYKRKLNNISASDTSLESSNKNIQHNKQKSQENLERLKQLIKTGLAAPASQLNVRAKPARPTQRMLLSAAVKPQHLLTK